MDIKEYRYIYTIAKEGGISRAAEKLYISQPSLSLYLKNLEERLGVRLFQYAGGVMRPTAEGELYIQKAGQILEIDENLMQDLEDFRTLRAGVVRIGIANTRSKYILPSLLRHLSETYPGIEIRIEESISSQLEELAYTRKVDFIIANRPFRTHDLEYRLINEEEAVLIVPEQMASRLRPRQREGFKYPWLSAEDVQDLPFTILSPGQRLGQAAESLFLTMSRRPRIILETQSADTAAAMAEEGLSVCMLYDSYILFQKTEGLRMYSIGDMKIPHQLVAAYPDEQYLSAAARAVMEEVIAFIAYLASRNK